VGACDDGVFVEGFDIDDGDIDSVVLRPEFEFPEARSPLTGVAAEEGPSAEVTGVGDSAGMCSLAGEVTASWLAAGPPRSASPAVTGVHSVGSE